jgi:hypothetical protein
VEIPKQDDAFSRVPSKGNAGVATLPAAKGNRRARFFKASASAPHPNTS